MYYFFVKQWGVFLLITFDEIAIGIALIFLIHYFTNLGWWVIGIIIVALFILIASKFYIFYPQFRKPRIGREEMIGLSGKVIKQLHPEGQVKIKGEIWKARAIENKINKGEKIEVVTIEGLKLLVRKVKE